MPCWSIVAAVLSLAPTPVPHAERLIGRRRLSAVVSGAAAALVATAASADGFVLAPPERAGLQARWLEGVRIFLQDEEDNVKYGGELAPGGPPSVVPQLRLLPIVQMQAALRTLLPLIADEAQWVRVLEVVSTGPFETLAFKKAFNAYSDNIYYTSSTAEANAYLLGGATPSTSQTTQYLLRNEILKQIGELRDEITYQRGLPAERRESEVADEYLRAALKCFDEYLALASPNELKFARDAVYGEGKQ